MKNRTKYTPMLFQIDDDPIKWVQEKSNLGTDHILKFGFLVMYIRDLEVVESQRFIKKEYPRPNPN